MKKYIAKRMFVSIVTILIILLLLFCMLQFMPGSPFNDEKLSEAQVQVLNQKYGLDQPIVVQAVVFGAILGILLGIVAALKSGTWIDSVCTVISVLGVSLPSYVFALAMAYTKDKDGNAILAAAESVDKSDDGLIYTFKLRDDAKWSDVTADDFVYAWQTLADPNTGSEYQFFVQTACLLNADDIVAENLAVSPDGTEFRKQAGTYDNWTYDVDAAKEYWSKGLSELGIDSLELEFVTEDSDSAQQVAQLRWIQKQDGMHWLAARRCLQMTVWYSRSISSQLPG